jgi:hypothetical protein
MATPALLIDCIGLAQNQRLFVGMHLVTGSARNLVSGVTAFQASRVRRLVQMAGEAEPVSSLRGQFRGVQNIVG